jgi:hypothetical protein
MHVGSPSESKPAFLSPAVRTPDLTMLSMFMMIAVGDSKGFSADKGDSDRCLSTKRQHAESSWSQDPPRHWPLQRRRQAQQQIRQALKLLLFQRLKRLVLLRKASWKARRSERSAATKQLKYQCRWGELARARFA